MNDNDSNKAPTPATREEILRRLQTICAIDITNTMNLTTLKIVPASFKGKFDELLLRQIAANQVTQFRVLQEVLQELLELVVILKPFDESSSVGGGIEH